MGAVLLECASANYPLPARALPMPQIHQATSSTVPRTLARHTLADPPRTCAPSEPALLPLSLCSSARACAQLVAANWSDRISSVRILPNVSVRLYDLADYGGPSALLTQSVDCLRRSRSTTSRRATKSRRVRGKPVYACVRAGQRTRAGSGAQLAHAAAGSCTSQLSLLAHLLRSPAAFRPLASSPPLQIT